MYALHTTDAGRITAIDRLDPPTRDWGRAVRVRLDPNDAEYQAFIAWNNTHSRVPVELTALPSNSLVCLGVDPLVAWCKHVPKMLFAKFDEESRLGSFHTEGIHDAGTARLCRLCEAWAFDPARGDAEPASGIVGTGTPIWVTNEILNDFNRALPNEDHDVRRIASCTIERTFSYVD